MENDQPDFEERKDPFLTVPSQSVSQESHDLRKKYEREPFKFKGGVFLEFMCYYLLNSILGPLSYCLFIKFIQNGPILARNLHVFGGKEEWGRTALWILKVFCYATAYPLPIKSISQFWLLIFTEISLCTMNAAYYCSFSSQDLKRFRTEYCDKGEPIFEKLLRLIQEGKTKFFERENLNENFPEIDVDNFFFVYPHTWNDRIPKELKVKSIEEDPDSYKPLGKGYAVDGSSYAQYLAEKSGYQNFDIKVKVIQSFSRFLVAIRILIPVLATLYTGVKCLIIYEEDDGWPTKHDDPSGYDYCKSISQNSMVEAILYLSQQIFFIILLYRFTAVYDVLFLGLLLYYKKLNLLLQLNDVIKIRGSDTTGTLKVNTMVPRNIQNWYAARRIFSEVNKQVFVIIDTNMSLVLFYIIFFIMMVFVIGAGLVNEIPALSNIEVLFIKNPDLLTSTVFLMITNIIVLVMDLALLVYINMIYEFDIAELNYHLGIIQTMHINQEFYKKKKLSGPGDADSDLFRKDVQEIKNMLQDSFEIEFYRFCKKLRDSCITVINSVTFELTYRPRKLLAIRADLKMVAVIATAISALGFSTIDQISQTINCLQNCSLPGCGGLCNGSNDTMSAFYDFSKNHYL